MEKIYDWKGNEIKPGDEICFILIKKVYNRFGAMYPEKGIVWEDKKPDEDCWVVSEYSKVDDNLCISTKHGDYIFTEPISSCILFLDTSNLVLAIKGVSDINPNL